MIRGIGLRGAIAINVITMIGIGPLVTIPLVLNQLHGSLALWAWIVGALIALCDGLVWAELGSRYPGSGGTYTFLREAFGREGLGRMLAFLFTWQTVLSAPLLLASGYIGFAHYAAYLWPPLADWRFQGIVASVVAIVTLAMLYRPIGNIARISIALGAIAVGTIAAVILAAVPRLSAAQALSADPHQGIAAGLAAGLGPALVITFYDYLGYGQACTVGDEVQTPQRTLPVSVVFSVLIVVALYVLLQLGVLGSVPWTSLVAATPAGNPPPSADYVASTVVEHGWGFIAAVIVTIAILITAFASTYGNLLGFSRIPYAAARDGVFLKPFADLHERGRFPHVSLVTIGLLAVPWCFAPLGEVISVLVAGLVIIQGIGQIAALVALRVAKDRAPYRMWLFPLPALVAMLGWCYIFYSSGSLAIAFGLLTLAAGAIVYLSIAKGARYWPFAGKAATLVALIAAAGLFASQPAQAAQTFTHAAIVQHDGFPVFEVDGKPFFVYGAAFFYERLPRDQWQPSMRALRSLGINTLDLYIMWNWHEPADGQFDFDGHTSPRRDLRTLLALARRYGFKLIVRPGPVIRNEWRNGGYPAWLLSRPEYGMPLHDLLEGRYPPTATLQNAHSDDAAAEWMRNATHLRYSERWLRRALREFAPYADLVLAVQLDDDQGAYLDNQTWPAPHLAAYLQYLKSVVHAATGPALPVFINTYQMKVTASSPVWAMGNWYQSDAYAIGEHDRAQLELSTGLLQTRPRQPLMYSEFQAGWLLGPDDIHPRPADPSNTELAMTTLLGMGARGIVNFPAQDTLYPTGWEAPFANWSYAWDAALTLDDGASRRWRPTARIGSWLQRYGSSIATARPLWDAAIAYETSSIVEAAPSSIGDSPSNAAVAAIAERTMQAQQACRAASLACRLIDLRYADAASLRDVPIIFVPPPPMGMVLDRSALRRLQALEATGKTVVTFNGPLRSSTIESALRHGNHQRIVDAAPGAAFAQAPSGSRLRGFFFLPNYGNSPLRLRHVVIRPRNSAPMTLPDTSIAARTALVTEIPQQGAISIPAPPVAPPVGKLTYEPPPAPSWARRVLNPPIRATPWATVSFEDAFADGFHDVVLENEFVRLVIAPSAGARAFVFQDKATHRNVFTSVGGLRDDVVIEPPLSTSDRIAKYTHTFPAGMFNRPFFIGPWANGPSAIAAFTYRAPDVLPNGAQFVRRFQLKPGERFFSVIEVVQFRGSSSDVMAIGQRAVSVTSLAVGDARRMTTQIVLAPDPTPFRADRTLEVSSGNALGFYDRATHELATIAWRPGEIEKALIWERHFSIVVRLTLSLDGAHSSYGYWYEPSIAAARKRLAEVAALTAGQSTASAKNASR